MTQIIDIRAREVLDSRGNPTIEADVLLECGSFGSAIAPSGASTGKHEAHELRDGDKKRYGGKGVLQAIDNVKREIAPLLTGHNAEEQSKIDRLMIELDGTDNKSRLGANAMLAVSLAVAQAAADSLEQPLYRYLGGVGARRMPLAMMNILNGGAHADNNLDIQEFMILPLSAKSFGESLRMGVEVVQSLRALLVKKGLSVNVGDEGGFAPSLSAHREALDLIGEAVGKAGLKLGKDIGLGLDCAATEFLSGKQYHLQGEGKKLDAAKMTDYLAALVKDYAIVSIEDGMGEDDWKGWELLTERLGDKVQLVGDDVFVTNPARLSMGAERGAATAILVKPNQIGTLTETMDVLALARECGYGAVVSHRSGESEDTCIADIAVAGGGGQIKCGAPVRAERTAKYNRLLQIEEELGLEAQFIGGSILR